MAQSSQPIISYNYGARRPDRVRQALNIAIGAAVMSGVVISLGMWQGSGVLARVFLDPADAAYGYATAGLPLLGLCALPFALNITFIGYYQSCERAVRSIIYMLLRGIVFTVAGFIAPPSAARGAGAVACHPYGRAAHFGHHRCGGCHRAQAGLKAGLEAPHGGKSRHLVAAVDGVACVGYVFRTGEDVEVAAYAP